MIRSPASPMTASAARPAIPGQPSPSQVANISAAAASANGWVSVNHSARQMSRSSWTTRITASGVRYTGERHTGGANGSRLSSWARYSPRTPLRLRGIRLASSHHAPSRGRHPGRQECPFLPPCPSAPSGRLTIPAARAGRAGLAVVVSPDVQPLDLSGEPGRLLGQLPGELHSRDTDLPVGDRQRHGGGPARDVQDRRVSFVGAQPRPPVLADIQADAPERTAAAFHAASL